ncbi:STAS domain-containing protein [Amycolatopsis cynarae]|uniref:STAS domain-containing protein n=1 Tax=Amycolatopsis cynarae TaxID=2995223 RepID=A0ABY7B1P5_9PSEU|nr:STAS domain-containing protein [Amycolatopsis sp. HUAS 11-8]WAL65885.1 STAS domain-containing protein [Amycolatopsis sp. HUAS 11-8]
MENLRIRVEGSPAGKALILRVEGEVDALTLDRFARQLRQVLACAVAEGAVVLELQQVHFLSCAGAEVLAEAQRRFLELGVPVEVKASRAVLRALQVTGLGKLLSVPPVVA